MASWRGGNGSEERDGSDLTTDTDMRRLAKEVLEVTPWKSREVALTDLVKRQYNVGATVKSRQTENQSLPPDHQYPRLLF